MCWSGSTEIYCVGVGVCVCVRVCLRYVFLGEAHF